MHVIGDGHILRTATIFFFIFKEGASLLDNAGHIGLPIPKRLKDVLVQLHEKE